MLLYMYQFLSSLLSHLLFCVHFFFTSIEYFFVDTLYLTASASTGEAERERCVIFVIYVIIVINEENLGAIVSLKTNLQMNFVKSITGATTQPDVCFYMHYQWLALLILKLRSVV